MRYFRSVVCGAVLLGCAWNGRAELGEWLQHLNSAAALDAIFFRPVSLPGGVVPSRRPPRETVVELTKAIAAAPGRSDLLYLRARERELNLDFAGAEADWKAYATAGKDSMPLADFYHARLQPNEELGALLRVARQPLTGRDGLLGAGQQRPWKALERALQLADAQALPEASYRAIYEEWVSRYAKEPAGYSRYFEWLVSRKAYPAAEALVARYRTAFPDDAVFPVQAQARVAEARGSGEEARLVYDRAFQPLWPPELVASYFKLLESSRGLRVYLANARAAVEKDPSSLDAAVRVFYYFQQKGNLPAASRALLEFRARKRTDWTAKERLTLAKLFEGTHNYVEAAREYLDLYTAAPSEEAIAGLAGLLLTAPEQALRVGSGDLTFYRDIATMDPYPGAFNGILSLLFNSTGPRVEFAAQESAAVTYFHRAKAAELADELERRFPASARRAPLQAKLIEAYASYGESAAVIRQGSAFLKAFAKGPERVDVALAMADAYARTNARTQEFAVYDALLKELGLAAGSVPLGSAGVAASEAAAARPEAVRSQAYVQVLDRYLARLVSLKQIRPALALYRQEIVRNPNDPGLYERLAQFLDQNKFAAEVTDTYARAGKQFVEDRTWQAKLARFYLRGKQAAEFAKLTQDVTAVFSGTELDAYFQQVVAPANLDAALYRQLNLFAHKRFPHDLVFVTNLLGSYEKGGNTDAGAYEALLRQNWYYDEHLRARFFEMLSRTKRLDGELRALASMPATSLGDRSAQELIAQAQVWQSHFENAAPTLQLVTNVYPGDRVLGERTASLFRSLGDVEGAVKLEERIARAHPRDGEVLERIGDIYADREQFTKAKPYWDRIPLIEPGKQDGYLEAATVYWDYFLFDDALRVIGEGRRKLTAPRMLAYEAGAIYESKRDFGKAIGEYTQAAMESAASPAGRRLLRLATMPAHKQAVETAAVQLSAGANPSAEGLAFRVAMLEEQNRVEDLRTLLLRVAGSTTSLETLGQIAGTQSALRYADVQARVLERQIVLTTDPVEKLRLRLERAKFAETHADLAGADRAFASVYQDSGRVLGVVRATVDFWWRTKRAKQALDVLEESAGRANATLRRRFLVEAVSKATESRDFARARKIVEPMLGVEPLAADLIALRADVFARSGDDAGLRSFLTVKLAEIPDVGRKAEVRRTLVPVLTRLKDFNGATDQYIEVMKRFPEDVGFLAEAAEYARSHGTSQRLLAYFVKAGEDSPKDARWPSVLARLHVQFEDLSSALASYAKAVALRPDRKDLLMERGALEERLMRWDEAAATYAKLYEVAYHDSQWMAKVAEIRARQGRAEESAKALRIAFIDGKPAKAADYFEAARLLESWNFLKEARQIADEGLPKQAKGEMDPTYARILARERQYRLLVPLTAAMEGPQRTPIWMVVAQVAKEYYTPEEKLALGPVMERAMPGNWDVSRAAGLLDITSRQLARDPQQLVKLEQSRLRFTQAAVQLERMWKAAPPEDGNRMNYLVQAAENYRYGGQSQNELRVLTQMESLGGLQGPLLARYGETLRINAPDRLVQVARAGSSPAVRDSAAQIAVAGSDAGLALRAVAARATGLPPVWGRAYTALTGYHFGRVAPEIAAAFEGALGPRTVGEQVGSKTDRTQQLAGDNWYPYAARYAEYLTLAKQDTAEDFLMAEVEARPASASPYVALGDWYRSQGLTAKAVEQYHRALSLNPDRADALNHSALAYASSGDLARAGESWKAALALLVRVQNGRVPETFWVDLRETVVGIAGARQMPALRADVDNVLRMYLRRNGAFRLEEVIPALVEAVGEADAAKWIADLSATVKDRSGLLTAAAQSQVFDVVQRAYLYTRLLEVEKSATWRLQAAAALLDARQYAEAQALLQSFTAEERSELSQDRLRELELRAAGGLGTIDVFLAKLQASDDPRAVRLERLVASAESLRQSGLAAAADKVLEFAYSKELELRNFSSANFLGLAEIRLKKGDVTGALALLKRMTLVGDGGFDSLVPAADLLDRFGRSTDAVSFRIARGQAVPWDRAAAVALAAVQHAGPALRALAGASDVPYEARVAAARGAGAGGSLGSGELDLLAAGQPVSTAAAEKPYYLYARLAAGESSQSAADKLRLLRGAVEIDPDNKAARLGLFQAAVDGERPQLTTSVFWSALENTSFRYERDAADTGSRIPRDAGADFLQSFDLDAKGRAKVAVELGRAYRKLGQLGAARLCFRVAERLDPSLQLATETRQVQDEAKLAAANALRMPKIGAALEQPGSSATSSGSCGRRAMKRALIVAAVLGAALWIYAQVQPGGGQPLASIFPGGPLLYVEAKDFGALLRDWNTSSEKKLWLANDNYSVFSRTHLVGRLKEEQIGFARAVGFTPGMSLASAVAGGQSAIAIYDIGKLEFLYVTRLASSRGLETLIGQARSSYETRQSAGRTYYVRNDNAFATADGLLLLATREDLMANALALLAKQPRVTALAQDRWFVDATAASKGLGDVRMAFAMPALLQSPYFRSYWIQRNRSVLAPYSSGVADLFREAGQIREERVLLRESAVAGNAQEAAAGQLAAFAPDDAGLSRVWAAPAIDDVVSLVRTKLVSPGPTTSGPRQHAPPAANPEDVAGSEPDLETPIDLPPLVETQAEVDLSGFRSLIDKAGVSAMLQAQSSHPAPGGLFITNESAVVLLGNVWNEAAVRAAVPGVQIRVAGKVLVLADRADILQKVVAKLGAAAAAPVSYQARYLHRQELAPYTAMMRSIDAGREGQQSPGEPRQPSFFSQNVASLGKTLGRLETATLSVRDNGSAVSQQMIYKLTP